MHTLASIRWHCSSRSNKEDVLRNSVDGEAWKEFDCRYLEFVKELKNVHLGLVTDGFNLFGNRSLSYSVCAVALMTYNLPP